MRRILGLCLVWLSASCVPDFDSDGGTLTEPRILALRGVPAEARPGDPIRFEVLLANPDGSSGTANFSYCNQARNSEERTGVSQVCLAGEALQPIGTNATVPRDACARFGPNTPPSEAGEPPRRPSDPDPTGGYFVPVLAEDERGVAPPSFGFQRVRCDLAGATREIFEAYQERYRANLHPEIVRVLASSAGELSASRSTMLTAESTELRLEVPLDSFEPYVVYSANDSALYDATETVRVNWYASAGLFDASATFVDPATGTATVRYTPPEDSGVARLWIVVSDSRGGSAWEQFAITVAPQ